VTGRQPPKPFWDSIVINGDTSLLSAAEMEAMLVEEFAKRSGAPEDEIGVWSLSIDETRKLNDAMAAFSAIVFEILDAQPKALPSDYVLRLIAMHVANAVAISHAVHAAPGSLAYVYAHQLGVSLGNAIAQQRARATPKR
jgi:hypothetical protein